MKPTSRPDRGALVPNPPTHRATRWLPVTFWLGLIIMLACEVLLFTDVHLSNRAALHSHASIESFLHDARPTTLLARWARFVAVNMTALVWVGYLFFLEGLLTWQEGKSPVRRRPHHFSLLCLASVFIWCIFDWVNFYFIRAWRYMGFPPDFADRAIGYFFAFATIVPGMMMTGQALMNARLFDWARGRGWRLPRWGAMLSLLAGLAMFLWPLVHRDPITNLTLWCSFVFLLDPINLWLGRPSMWRDWQNGWYGRTLAAFAGGLGCGLLWEFWNYWALAKWTYHLPFLGAAEHVRYFEMPVIGLVGFLPFGLECWVIWQTLRIALDGLAEPLPGERWLI